QQRMNAKRVEEQLLLDYEVKAVDAYQTWRGENDVGERVVRPARDVHFDAPAKLQVVNLELVRADDDRVGRAASRSAVRVMPEDVRDVDALLEQELPMRGELANVVDVDLDVVCHLRGDCHMELPRLEIGRAHV